MNRPAPRKSAAPSAAGARATPRTTVAPRSAAAPATPPPQRRRGGWRLVFFVLPALIAAAVAGMFVLDRRPETRCARWEREAGTADATRVAELVAQLDAYDDFGLPALVRLLAADRETTRAAAADVLRARIRVASGWGAAADRAVPPRIAAELRTLAAGRKKPLTQAACDVALELLEAVGRLGLAEELGDDARREMLLACDEVLRLAPTQPESPLRAIVGAGGVVAAAVDEERAAATQAVPDPAGEAPSVVENVAAPTYVAPPSAAMPQVVASPAQSVAPPEPPTIAANTAARINPFRTEATVDAAVRPAGATEPLAAPPPATQVSTGGDAWSLFAALHGDNAARAEDELRRRGFNDRELDLGRRLTSGDVAERRHYARALPTIGGVDVRPWLLFLSRDADAEVRLTVATIMATGGDPELQARLRTMSLDDGDERVRATAARAVGVSSQRR